MIIEELDFFKDLLPEEFINKYIEFSNEEDNNEEVTINNCMLVLSLYTALGNDINLIGMKEVSLQGDKKIIDDIKSMNGEITFTNGVLKCRASQTKGAVIDFSQSPDLGPALAVLASVSLGTSHFINASRLRIKECDRITCVLEELNKMGANIEETPDSMIINGVKELHGCVLDSHNDHRLAMAFAMAATICDSNVKILNAECVSKSYPNFWEDYIKLGGVVDFE